MSKYLALGSFLLATIILVLVSVWTRNDSKSTHSITKAIVQSNTGTAESGITVFTATSNSLGEGTVGIIGPGNAAELTRQATLIVVGSVTNIQDLGTTAIPINGKPVEVLLELATVQVDRTLKGNYNNGNILVEFYQPKDVNIDLDELSTTQYGMFFLKENKQARYSLVDPHWSFIPGVSTAPARQTTDQDRVIAEIANVIRYSNIPINDRKYAINILQVMLQRSNIPAASAALMSIMSDRNSPLRFYAAVALLESNNISALNMVADAMLKKSPEITEDLCLALSDILNRSVTDSAAIPMLTQLLVVSNVEVRRGASNALRNTASKDAIEPLALIALNDSDGIVRYNAVIGLSEITKQDEWGPSLREFQAKANQQKYLDYWRKWVGAR